ncbi:MAG: alpha/beta hydrolase [Rubrivivax sp.]|nr:alpha/beta hydrolase [Rubrivivax sp.]
MRRRTLFALAAGPAGLWALGSTRAQSAPEVGTGRIERIEFTAARHVVARPVDVWLPADYSPRKRYQVLYMHDGQNLFDGRHAFGGKSWQVDVAVDRLVRAGRIPDTIIVGIWNAGVDRYAEYYPEKFLAFAPEAVRREYVELASNGRSLADAYLRFIVEELKPAIDGRYATKPGPEGTFVAGSSMGGLISLYALAEYPQVFGGAAGLSTHWVGRPTAWGRERVRNAALPLAAMTYLSRKLPSAGHHRLYTDRGDDWLDSLYAPGHRFVAEVLRDRGYTTVDARTPVIDGTGHNEADWAARLPEVLAFLLAAR